MRVLLINGSPHENGCTARALREVATTIEESGIETELFQLGTAPVRGCSGCYRCAKQPGRCVFDDDAVNRAIERAGQADGLIVGSPVYYAGPNGALLALLDRMFYAGYRGTAGFAGKPGAAVVSARRAGTTAALDVLNKYFLISGMPIVPSQYWNMVHGNTPAEVEQDAEGLQIMRTLGRNMAWMLRSFAAGRAAGIEPPQPETPWQRTNFIR